MIISYNDLGDDVFVVYSEGNTIPLIAKYGVTKIDLIKMRLPRVQVMASRLLTQFDSTIHNDPRRICFNIGRFIFHGTKDELMSLVKKVNDAKERVSIILDCNEVTMSEDFRKNSKIAALGVMEYKVYKQCGATFAELTNEAILQMKKDNIKHNDLVLRLVVNVKDTHMTRDGILDRITATVHMYRNRIAAEDYNNK